jgi:hypothetical protein
MQRWPSKRACELDLTIRIVDRHDSRRLHQPSPYVMQTHACLSEILTARSEPRCNLLTIAVWFDFSLIPGDSRSGKQSAPGRKDH